MRASENHRIWASFQSRFPMQSVTSSSYEWKNAFVIFVLFRRQLLAQHSITAPAWTFQPPSCYFDQGGAPCSYTGLFSGSSSLLVSRKRECKDQIQLSLHSHKPLAVQCFATTAEKSNLTKHNLIFQFRTQGKCRFRWCLSASVTNSVTNNARQRNEQPP